MTKIRPLTAINPPDPSPGAVLLETERLVIRRFRKDDAPALAEAGNHRDLWANMSDRFPSPYTKEAAEDFISDKEGASEGFPAEYPARAAILVKASRSSGGAEKGGGEPVLIGSLGVRPGSDINYRMWEIGYFLTPSAWGKGYGTEAISALVRWLMGNWPELMRVQASTYEFNEKSGRVLIKSGFVREGLRRDAAEKCGKVTGEIWYGFTRSDFEESMSKSSSS